MTRTAFAAIAAALRTLPMLRLVLTCIAMAVVVAVALLVRLPSAVQLRDWSLSMGPWLPLAFLAAHTVVTVLPFPRTAFTLAAGLLFGPVLGVTLAVVASTASAVIAVTLVRAAGWQLGRLVGHQAVETVDARLRARGWIAVLSLRLIPAVPFAPLNYAVGASAVPLSSCTLATAVGVLPGTAAVVVLGDALTGHLSPSLTLVSLCTGLVGIALLGHEIRLHRRDRRSAATAADDTAR